MRQADVNRDGRLSLQEILDNARELEGKHGGSLLGTVGSDISLLFVRQPNHGMRPVTSDVAGFDIAHP